MDANRSSARFRRELADRVIEELDDDLPRVSAHFGEEYAEKKDDPKALSLHDNDGTFDWVAFGFDPYSMWDLHIGVLTESRELIMGIHIHKEVSENSPDEIAALAEEFNAEYRYSESASEHQFNLQSRSIDKADLEETVNEVTNLCRGIAPLVDEVIESGSV